jgi:8-oxo-dGTP pyrophosphatase MutT (NUDIX family)
VYVAGTPAARAAVAMVLRDRGDDTDVLLIHRATRDGDPWSGHMALPGGRHDPRDRDIIHTAARETLEEVGIDIERTGELIGRLDELHAVARHRPLDLVISPTVWHLQQPVDITPHPREVADALWVPLSHLCSADGRGLYQRTLDGVASEYPAFIYTGHTIWGLTHRILDSFLDVVCRAKRE